MVDGVEAVNPIDDRCEKQWCRCEKAKLEPLVIEMIITAHFKKTYCEADLYVLETIADQLQGENYTIE